MKRKAATPTKTLTTGETIVVAKETRGTAASSSTTPHEPAFREVINLIQRARQRAFQAVNNELIELYWPVGEFISHRIAVDGWGKNTVVALADFIRRSEPGARGFSAQNLWRMRQFYETWRRSAKLSTLLRELSWSHNLLIFSRCKRPEEREFYLRLASRNHLSFRQLERQMNACLFERAVLNPPKVAPLVRESHPDAQTVFKDTYVLDFLNLPTGHSDCHLQKALVANLRKFMVELGPDFCFAGEQLRLQVGGRDFLLDLLFFHRTLQCLVAFELKVRQFEPEHLGKMNFYLEALDRDVKKPHEHPSIGILLCATKDNEVVEYALSRSASPALIAKYQTVLPDKRLLRRKLHEFYQLSTSFLPEGSLSTPGKRPKALANPAKKRG